MIKIEKRPDHSWPLFFRRTIAAQTHLVTLMMALIGLIYLLPKAEELGPLHYWGSFAFGVSAIGVFFISSLYHFLHDGYTISPRLIELMETLDHCAIYLFIAGTYTPFLVNAVQEPWKSALMLTVWSMALMGILYTALKHRLPTWAQSRAVYTGLFVMMGWTLLLRIGEIWDSLSETSLVFLLLGAGAYTLGAVVYSLERPALKNRAFGSHEIWHVMVSMGFAFHYAMVLNFYS